MRDRPERDARQRVERSRSRGDLQTLSAAAYPFAKRFRSSLTYRPSSLVARLRSSWTPLHASGTRGTPLAPRSGMAPQGQ